MISFIYHLLKKHSLSTSQYKNLSVVYLCKTKPIYLIFNDIEEFPKYVIKKGSLEQLNNNFFIAQFLFREAPGLVAKPLINTSSGYYIEEGLVGVTWQNFLSTGNSVEKLKLNALSALLLLQEATKNNKGWTSEINLNKHKIDILKKFNKLNPSIYNSIKKPLQKFISISFEDKYLTTYFQHCDYCLNNLLFNKNICKVIDLEEFGQLSSPLYDEFSLALSFHNSLSVNGKDDIIKQVHFCCKHNTLFNSLNTAQVNLSFILFLMEKITLNCRIPKRKQHNKKLVSLLQEFIYCK